jgi:large subunit ribosomal protein L9
MSGTKVILRQDIANVGKRGDICEVSDGYARNYLFPKQLAIVATDGAVNQAASMRRARDVRDAQDRSASEEVARRLVPKVITIVAKAGPEGRLFGSVTAADVVQAVSEQAGIDLDRRKLLLNDPIKALGTHSVAVRLHTDVEFPVTVEVVAG